MDNIMNQFREYDINVLILKKHLILQEIKKNKDFEEKLTTMLTKIENAIQEIKVTTYEYDSD